MKATGKLAAVAGATLLATSALAAPSVEITNVQQQYPWTNTVDITYTVAGVKDFPAKTATGGYASNETYFVTFTAKNGTAAIADTSGNTVLTNALVEGSGTQYVQWNPEMGLQLAGCNLTPSVFRGEDDAYFIVNLETNAEGKCDWWFEPMSTQPASNARYNTDEYKTRKMVFRVVRAGEWPVRRVANNVPVAATASFDRDYAITIFPVTVAQYSRIMGLGDSQDTKPQCGISYLNLRGGAGATADVLPSDSGEVIARLNLRTGRLFDLPDLAMYQAAIHANTNKDWLRFFGNGDWRRYSTTRVRSSVGALGNDSANPWGLFDALANVDYLCRDTVTTASWNGTGNNSLDISLTLTPTQTGAYVPKLTVRNFPGDATEHQVSRDISLNNVNSQFGFRLALILD